MKTLKSISQTIQKWRHQRYCESNGKHSSLDSQPLWFSLLCKVHPPVMLLLAVTTLTGVISYRFYNQPELAVGTISPSRIVAPADAIFEDAKTTEEWRKKTRTGLLPVLKQDQTITYSINLVLTKQLNQIEKARQIAGKFPYLSQDILSISTQKYLRQLPEEKWQEVQEVLTNEQKLSTEYSQEESKVFEELITYSKKVNQAEFDYILSIIEEARQRYQNAKIELSSAKIGSLSNQDKEILITITARKWHEIRRIIKASLERILVQGIPPGLPDKILRKTVVIQLGESLSPQVKIIATQFLSEVLQPNLVIDEQETKNRAERAAKEIEPVLVSIEKNQLIVDVGEEITQSEFVLLDGFGLSRRGINWVGIGVSALFASGSLVIFLVIAKQVRRNLRRRDQILLWLLSLTVTVIAVFDVRYNSLPALGFLVSSFYGPTLAITNVSLMTGLVLFQTGSVGWEYLLASYAGSVLASFIASRLHSREELALLGASVGLIQGGAYLVINLILSTTAGTIWYAVLPGAFLYGSIGLAYSVVALGISPYLERFFDLITPIRLAELSNPNRPLLKRLAIEAPGTFQHTMFVASLAEAAARELHCNVELVRAGTLYHDIGKMHDPLGFIENQMGGPNKHDRINDPWQSAEIIKKHVSEGLIIASQYGLPRAIRDFIPQHQGTLLISYFYFQAKDMAEGESKNLIREEDFRYDGPIPQSRETGIVMLADGCEAALRSLKDATPEIALATIKKIFQARWREHQLAESGIKYAELPLIAEVFVRVWQQFNHQRIAYPKAALEVRRKRKISEVVDKLPEKSVVDG